MKSIQVCNISKFYSVERNNYNFKEFVREGILGLFSSEKRIHKGNFYALKDISFDLDQGDVLGIIGDNGAGKSTLLKIMSGVSQPSEGEVVLDGKVSSILEIGTGFHLELTGKENIFLSGSILGMSLDEIKSKYSSIVKFSGVDDFINVPIKRYSSGMYVRLAFSVLAHLNTDIILLDEIIYVGDAEFKLRSYNKIKQLARSGKTILIVSHDLASIADLCTKCLLLVKGEVKLYGKVSEVVREYLDKSLQKFINISKEEDSSKKIQEEVNQLQEKIAKMDSAIKAKEEVLSNSTENEQRLNSELERLKEDAEELYRIRDAIQSGSGNKHPSPDSFVQEQCWSDEIQAPGNDIIKIKRIAVTTAGEKIFRQDEDIFIEFEYWKYVEEQITIGLVASYNFNQLAFGTASTYGEKNIVNNTGIGFYKNVCTINKFFLNQGLFSFSVFFIDQKGEIICSMNHALFIKIEPSLKLNENFNYEGMMAPFMVGLKWG